MQYNICYIKFTVKFIFECDSIAEPQKNVMHISKY